MEWCDIGHYILVRNFYAEKKNFAGGLLYENVSKQFLSESVVTELE